MTSVHRAVAVLHNGLGRYADALMAAEQATTQDANLYDSMWALPELIEAARTGNPRIAGDALRRLTETTRAGGTDVDLGLEARC